MLRLKSSWRARRGAPGRSTGRIILPETLVRWQEEHCRSGRRALLLEPPGSGLCILLPSEETVPTRSPASRGSLRPGALPGLRPERLGSRMGLCLALQGAGCRGCGMWGPECHLEGPEWVEGAESGVRAAASPCFSMLSGGGCLGALSTRPVPPRAPGFPSPRRPPAYPSGRGGTGQPPPPSPTPAPQFRVCRLNLFHLSARHLRALRGCMPPLGAWPPPHLLLRRSREPPSRVGPKETPPRPGSARGERILRGRSASGRAARADSAGTDGSANAPAWCRRRSPAKEGGGAPRRALTLTSRANAELAVWQRS